MLQVESLESRDAPSSLFGMFGGNYYVTGSSVSYVGTGVVDGLYVHVRAGVGANGYGGITLDDGRGDFLSLRLNGDHYVSLNGLGVFAGHSYSGTVDFLIVNAHQYSAVFAR